MASFRTLDQIEVKGKCVLVRADLNVPMQDGRIADMMRIDQPARTLKKLAAAGTKVIVLSHFGRPDGKVVPALSLKPLVPALSASVGRTVAFAADCIGEPARTAVARMKDGEILLLENTRFHAGEEENDLGFAQQLAALGEIFVNDAFSVAHRAHATTVGLAGLLPSAAGLAMACELDHLEKALGNPVHPVMAVVGGAKVSTKIALLANLLERVDTLVIGGAMANTFLAAEGFGVGKSLYEKDQLETARRILHQATETGTVIILPVDAVAAKALKPHVAHRIVALDGVAPDEMILDVGPASIEAFGKWLHNSATLVWNGPLGAFEIPPFDAGTTAAAKLVAAATRTRGLLSVAGGGDTLAALARAGVTGELSYVSAAGGAFLEWMEGQELPGVEALKASKGQKP